jgi:hypothetical protein
LINHCLSTLFFGATRGATAKKEERKEKVDTTRKENLTRTVFVVIACVRSTFFVVFGGKGDEF